MTSRRSSPAPFAVRGVPGSVKRCAVSGACSATSPDPCAVLFAAPVRGRRRRVLGRAGGAAPSRRRGGGDGGRTTRSWMIHPVPGITTSSTPITAVSSSATPSGRCPRALRYLMATRWLFSRMKISSRSKSNANRAAATLGTAGAGPLDPVGGQRHAALSQFSGCRRIIGAGLSAARLFGGRRYKLPGSVLVCVRSPIGPGSLGVQDQRGCGPSVSCRIGGAGQLLGRQQRRRCAYRAGTVAGAVVRPDVRQRGA